MPRGLDRRFAQVGILGDQRHGLGHERGDAPDPLVVQPVADAIGDARVEVASPGHRTRAAGAGGVLLGFGPDEHVRLTDELQGLGADRVRQGVADGE